jgi:hypothetical protein
MLVRLVPVSNCYASNCSGVPADTQCYRTPLLFALVYPRMYRRHTPRLYQMLWVVFVLLVTLNVVLFTGHQVGAFCDLDSSPFSNTFPEVPRALVEKRKQLQSQMKEESPSCDFPIHYDMYRALHFYEENNFVKESDIPSRKSYFDYWYKNSQARHGEGLRKERDEKLSKRERSISFLAIGKAGGSSLTCNLRAALPFAYHCPTYDAQNQTVKAFWGTNESALSKQVTCYNHCDTNLFCYDNPSFLLNLRNPISRIKSWYHYEHPVNMKNSMYSSCGRRMLFTCYSTFDELATYGLEGPRPAKTHTLRIGADLTENECRHWAWATVEGSMPATWHNFFNYNW